MIHAHISNSQTRALLAQVPAFRMAFDWIVRESERAPDGIVTLQGPELYVNVHGYETRPRAETRWESHRRTADLQFCRAGNELIEWAATAPGVASVSYDAEKDFEFWPDGIAPANSLRLSAGMFAVFLPGELHRPMIADGAPAPLRKLVVKIAAELLPCAGLP